MIIFLFVFSRKIILPITKTTSKIKDLKLGKDFRFITYTKKDEIGYLVNAINELNTKLYIGENIRNKLLTDISHELKTPITAIQCYVEGIKDGIIKLDKRTLDSIINEMQRLVKLVNKIMEFEKFETQKINLKLKKQDIKYTTEQVIVQFKQKLKNSNQRIITRGLNKIINIDKDIYIQIVQNIISNFMKYAGKGTTLEIEFGVNFVLFKDNGKGVAKTELPYIKEKFYQGINKESGNIEDRGIGVGLSVIDKLVQTLNWELEIFSEEGKGFEIKIRF